MSQLAPSFSGSSCSKFHLGGPISQSSIMHKSQCLASRTCWFFFFFAWFYWAGLGRILPRAIKNTCFLVNFSPIHTLTELGFSGNISVEKLEQQLGSFSKQPSSLICLEILILSSQRFDLRPDFISSSAWQLSNLSFSAVEFHDLDT